MHISCMKLRAISKLLKRERTIESIHQFVSLKPSAIRVMQDLRFCFQFEGESDGPQVAAIIQVRDEMSARDKN